MTDDIRFVVVDDSFRVLADRSRFGAVIRQLKAGKTLRCSIDEKTMRTLRVVFSRRELFLKMVVRRDGDDYIIWCEPRI